MKLLGILCLVSLIVIGSAQSDKCSDIFKNTTLLVSKVKTFVDTVYTNFYKNDTVKSNLTSELDTLMMATANSQGVASTKLGHCVNLVDNTKKTCCNARWVSVIRFTIDRYIMELSKSRPPIFKLIDDFRQKLVDKKCLSSTQLRTLQLEDQKIAARIQSSFSEFTSRILSERDFMESLQDEPDLKEEIEKELDEQLKKNMQDFLGNKKEYFRSENIMNLQQVLTDETSNQVDAPSWSDYKGESLQSGPLLELRAKILGCQANALIALRRFLVGQSCLFCVNNDNYTQFFNDETISLGSMAVEKYEGYTARALKCHSDIATELKALVDRSDTPISSNITECKAYISTFQSALSNSEIMQCSSEQSCLQKCQSSRQFMDDSCFKFFRSTQNTYFDRRNLQANQFTVTENGFQARVVDTSFESLVKVGPVDKNGAYDIYDISGSKISSLILSTLLLILATLF